MASQQFQDFLAVLCALSAHRGGRPVEHFRVQESVLTHPDGARRLSNPTLLLCVVGVLLPNALSIGALIAGIGSPPRTSAIIAYATLLVVARIVPPAVTVVLYLIIVAYDVVSTVSLLFGLAPSEIVLALNLTAQLDLFASPLYIALIAGLAALLAANIFVLVRKRETLRRGNIVAMMGFALCFAATDLFANTSAHYQFGTLYAAGKPMESAVAESGFHQAALTGRAPRVVLVVVEALGHFADPAHQAILLKPFLNADLRRQYDVSFGSTTYYGSTTAAEMRELCNTRESYREVLNGKTFDCLPEQMEKRGYSTISLHNFTGLFFGRYQWYPKLGFQERLFSNNIDPAPPRQCGGPFRGPCDADVVPFIERRLKAATNPTFFYWMTLSTHVPIAPHEGTPRLNCAEGGGRIGHVEVCYMTELWLDLFNGLTQLARDLPGTELLLVGDHAPPLWSKAGRNLFTPGKVTWVHLRPRTAAAKISGLPQ
jgi:hypothetical protein